MVTEKIWRVGDSYVVIVPPEEMERQGLHEGDVVGFEVRRLAGTSPLAPEIVAAVE